MDINEHKKKFQEIIIKYNLNTEQKAQEIADFLTKHKNQTITAKEFAKLFIITEKDAAIFLSFISKGLDFKTKHIDKK